MCGVKMVHMFAVSSVVRGHREYKDIWNAPNDGAYLSCEREPGNIDIEHR